MKRFIKIIIANFTSRKFLMTIFALVTLWCVYWGQVANLHGFSGYESTMAGQLITAYTSITRDFMVAFTSAILGYLGINGIISWKHNTDNAINQVAQVATQKIEQTIHTINENVPNSNLREFQE